MATTKKTMKKIVRAAKPRAEKAAPSLEAQIYSMKGDKVSMISLPEKVFAAPWRSDLVHQVTTAMQANARQNRAHTKDRSEVSGGGKKPWKQKGTGQARHGSSRSPIWRHGGVTFGPRSERDYSEKINRKMRIGALVSALSRKAKDGEVVLIDRFAFEKPKTADAVRSLAAVSKAAHARLLASNGSHSALVVFSGYNANAIKSFRNIQGVATDEARNVNPVEVLSHKYVVIENPKESFQILLSRAKSRD